jgi:hypothetical protein
MAGREPKPCPPHPEWVSFAARHTNHRFLAAEAIYSLEARVIDAIQEEIPGFFSRDDEQFERDLVETAGLGFFLKQPMGHSVGGEHPEAEVQVDDRQQASAREINRLYAEELRDGGADAQEIQDHSRRADERNLLVTLRHEAFAGWLALNRRFQNEVKCFRDYWGANIQSAGRFPILIVLWPGSGGGFSSKLPQKFCQACFAFFTRWGLNTMASWDWPIPLDPVVGSPRQVELGLIRESGLSLVIPWHLLRGDKLDLQDYVRDARIASTPDHLREWVNKSSANADGIDDRRYSILRWLYRCYSLSLLRRYPAVCKRNMGRLDIALASVIKRDADTIRKLRLSMKKLLTRD